MATNSQAAGSLKKHDLRQEEELYLVLYANQVYEGKDESNQDVVIDTGIGNKFGSITAYDWPVYDGPDTSKLKPVARVQGQHIQSDKMESGHWFHTGNIVFEKNSRHPGSTIVLTGSRCKTDKEGEWAIVGGTGRFTFAQGVIYYKVAKKNRKDGKREDLIRLDIRVLYRPVKKSEVKYVFGEFSPSEVAGAIEGKKPIGQGGFGTVYKAYIRDATVAVKILKPETSKAVRDLTNEIERFKTIRHENLVTLKGACIDKHALIYEFCHNGTLGDRLFPGSSSIAQGSKALTWKQRVEVARSICAGLKFLHDELIAHRDLKPNNILFDKKDVCKICDFGTSRLLKYTSDTATPIHYTVPMGTPDYCDPQCIGKPMYKLTRKSDVYSLGIILLQLVTGQVSRNLRKSVLQKETELAAQTTENKCKELVDAAILDELLKASSKQDEALEMIYLGLECSSSTGKKRPDVATVSLKIESMAKCNKRLGSNTQQA